MKKLLLATALVAVMSSAAQAQVYITEWMYDGDEFIEFTNVGASAVDFTGWSFDDNSQAPGSVDLSAFGSVATGESVILSQAAAATFRANWGLGLSVKVIGGNTHNLGRADEINIYNGVGTLVDRLTYDDQGTGNVDGPRTNVASGITFPENWGDNNASTWFLSVNGQYGSTTSSGGFIGNPGTLAVPEPTAAAMLIGGLAMLALRRRRA